MARSDAIMPMYQMIHIAQSPRINPRAVGSKLELWAPRGVELGPLLPVKMEFLQVWLSSNPAAQLKSTDSAGLGVEDR